MSSLVLSVFPGIDLLGMAFEEEGFCVVRGPDLLWGGDIRRFHPPAGKFDGVIGGPPCQFWSAFKRLNPNAGKKHGNLIPEFERVVHESSPSWFLMENVPDAPIPSASGYLIRSQLIRDVWVGGETSRLRRFSFGTTDGRPLNVEILALHTPTPFPTVCSDARVIPVALNGKRRKKPGISRLSSGNGPRLPIAEMLLRQGFPAELLDNIPFTESGKRQAIGNGVPFPMGRAVARAVKKALSEMAMEKGLI